MKITNVVLEKEINGIGPFKMNGLGEVVILAGSNGCGKSRLLKLLTEKIRLSQAKVKLSTDSDDICKDIQSSLEIQFRDQNDEVIENGLEQVSVLNYTHYDIPLQLPEDFSPYVISKSVGNLTKCDFEDTANEALLYIYYIAKYEKDKFEQFSEFLKRISGISIGINKSSKELEICKRSLKEHGMSPGQQYLLRMCVALFSRQKKDDKILLILDEPEAHLHPEALINIINSILDNFSNSQIWIATHSIALLSKFAPKNIWYMEQKKEQKKEQEKEQEQNIKMVGSKSTDLLRGLIGDDIRRMEFHKFLMSPDWFACSVYASECLKESVASSKSRNDVQVEMVADIVKSSKKIQSGEKINVVDYGAGKGRLLDGIGFDHPKILESVNYIAYNKFSDDNAYCKDVMEKLDVSYKTNYFNDISVLKDKYKNSIEIVFLVNVLHEIHPDVWKGLFDEITYLLKEKGKLVIIELGEFTYGEKAYTNGGFLVVQEESFEILENSENVICGTHKTDNRIKKYEISKAILETINENKIKEMINKISEISLKNVKDIYLKSDPSNVSIDGLRLAFWTQQYTNAQIILEEKSI